MMLKSVFIIAIVAVAMIGIMVPNVFAVEENVTIEGNLNPFNRSEEVYVVKVNPSNEHRDITFSIYGSDGVIFSKTSFIKSSGSYENFFVKFFPPLFEDNMKYTIEVIGDGLVGRQIITIGQEFASYQSEPLPNDKFQSEESAAAEQAAAEQAAAEQAAAEQAAAEQAAAEQAAAEQAAARAAEARAAEARAAEARAAEARAAEARAAEARAAEDAVNSILLVIFVTLTIFLLVLFIKRKTNNNKTNNNKKSNNSSSSSQNKNNRGQIFCNNCGSRMLGSSYFCNNCGNSSSDKKTHNDNPHNPYENNLQYCYDILEVNPNATPQEIKTARNRLALQWHPDKHRSLDRKVMAEKETKKINAAYAELRKAGKVS
jgi:hypothetical protein